MKKTMRRLPSFRALHCFEVTVRRGTLTAAAHELNITTSAVSRQLTTLEQHVGTTLMRRDRTGISMTSQGRILYERLTKAFTSIGEALDEIMEHRDDATITVSAYPTFAIQWLVPRLADLYAIAPDVDLRLRPSLEDRPFDSDGIDIAITIGPPPEERFHSNFLFKRRFTPVCSPTTLRRAESDLFDCLRRTRIFYSDRQINPWRMWLEAVGLQELDLPETGIRFENSSLAYQATREGFGFAIGQPTLLRGDLETGRLVAPFPQIVEGQRQYFVACRKHDRERPEIRLFMDWLATEARKSENATTATKETGDASRA